jgi:hypothetical protein
MTKRKASGAPYPRKNAPGKHDFAFLRGLDRSSGSGVLAKKYSTSTRSVFIFAG